MTRTGELYINNLDAYTNYRAWVESISPLRQFAPVKEYTENKSPLRDGKEVDPTAPKVDERDVTLVLYVEGRTEVEMENNLDALEAVLRSGTMEWRIPRHNSKVYRLKYVSCTQFSDYNGRLAKFILKLNEPNPKDRGEHTA